MTPAMAQLLRENRAAEFLARRQELMHATIAQFLGRNCEWGFEDTPPLAELVIEDEDDDAEQ